MFITLTETTGAKIRINKATITAYLYSREKKNTVVYVNSTYKVNAKESVLEIDEMLSNGAASAMLDALKAAADALQDIIGSADNGEPYNAQELANFFIPVKDACNAEIAKAEGIKS